MREVIKTEREREDLKRFLTPFRECVQALPKAIGIPKDSHDPSLPITLFIHLLLNEFGKPENKPEFWEQLQFAVSLKHKTSSHVDTHLTREYNERMAYDRHSTRLSLYKKKSFEFNEHYLCLTHAYSAIKLIQENAKPVELPKNIDPSKINADQSEEAAKVINTLRAMGSLPTEKTDGIKFLLLEQSPNKCMASLIRLWKSFCKWVINTLNRLLGQTPAIGVPRDRMPHHTPKPYFFIAPPQKTETRTDSSELKT